LTALGPVDYLLMLADVLVEVCCLVFLFKRKAFSRYFTLILFLCSSIAIGIGRIGIIKTAGFTSNAYGYFYFYSDFLLTICLYFVLMSLYSHVFSEMGVSKFVRGGAMLLLAGTAGISYYMVAASTDRLVTHFVIELGQNLYFVGVLLTYLLWGAMVKMRENRTRLTQLVLSTGVILSAFAGSYALDNLYPRLALWRYYFPLINMWLPVSWAYTFWKVPEDARIVTARVLAPNR
jgi:hypothetical protein